MTPPVNAEVAVGTALISMELSDGSGVLGAYIDDNFFEIERDPSGKAFAIPIKDGVYVRKYAYAVTYLGANR